jgi:hypothetical protein
MLSSPRTISALAAVVTAAGAIVAGAAAPAAAAVGTTAVTVPGYAFRTIGEQTLPSSYRYAGVGGLSGIDYNPTTGRWYAISNDPSERQPARYYSLDLGVTQAGLGQPCVKDRTYLKRPDGTYYPESSVAPEAIRYDAAASGLIWGSQGERIVPADGTAPTLIDPAAYKATTTGTEVGQLTQPAVLKMSAGNTGPRGDRALKGLTLSANGNGVITAMEGPLLQDGAEPTTTAGAPVRVTFHSKATGQPLSQVVYNLDPLPAASPTGGAAYNGVVEILAVDNTRFLMLERAYAEGVGYSVRLYEMDLTGATSVLNTSSLVGATYAPTTKRLLIDFNALGLSGVGNIAGMGWGPTFANGERSLVFVSDDNFSSSSQTKFIALGVTLS